MSLDLCRKKQELTTNSSDEQVVPISLDGPQHAVTDQDYSMPIGSNTSIENDNAAIASKNNPAIVDNPAYSTGSGPPLIDNPAYTAMKSDPATTVLSDYSNN